LQRFLNLELYNHLAADPWRQSRRGRYAPPGKKEIIRLTDGVKTLIYTKARRDRECRFLQNKEKILDKKQHRVCFNLELPVGDTVLKAPTIEEIETVFLTTFNTKSCSADRFVAYLGGRRLVAPHLAAFYRGACFRSSKYSTYLAKKASEDKLVDRIRNMFGSDGKAIVIFWGNWGQQPNSLRNSPSTPGIGLRRFIHRRLMNDVRHVGHAVALQRPEAAANITYFGTTLTVYERKSAAEPRGALATKSPAPTSSVCNACGCAVEHVVGPDGKEMHRVLRCVGGCGRAWHRDDLGSLLGVAERACGKAAARTS
jgi:hypothetical protein